MSRDEHEDLVRGRDMRRGRGTGRGTGQGSRVVINGRG